MYSLTMGRKMCLCMCSMDMVFCALQRIYPSSSCRSL